MNPVFDGVETAEGGLVTVAAGHAATDEDRGVLRQDVMVLIPDIAECEDRGRAVGSLAVNREQACPVRFGGGDGEAHRHFLSRTAMAPEFGRSSHSAGQAGREDHPEGRARAAAARRLPAPTDRG